MESLGNPNVEGLLTGQLYKVGPPNDSVQLVHITPMSLWFMVPITIVFMGFINHLITGGPHLVRISYPEMALFQAETL